MASIKNKIIKLFENKKVRLLVGILAISLFIIILLAILSNANSTKIVIVKEGMDVNKETVVYDKNGNVVKNTTYTGEEGRGVEVEKEYDMSKPMIDKEENTCQGPAGNNVNQTEYTGPAGNTVTQTEYTGPAGNELEVDKLTYNNPIDPNAPVPQFDISKTQEEIDVDVEVEGPETQLARNPNPTLLEKALSKEIPGSEIPPGDEDLYILKSQVVPPVCPECPNPVIPREKPCPPCPPCGRCPPNAYDCKQVPNYSAMNSAYVPRAVINDFSNF